MFLRLGSLAQLNRASDYGSEGYRFESCRSHKLDNEVGIFVDLNFFCDVLKNEGSLIGCIPIVCFGAF